MSQDKQTLDSSLLEMDAEPVLDLDDESLASGPDSMMAPLPDNHLSHTHQRYITVVLTTIVVLAIILYSGILSYFFDLSHDNWVPPQQRKLTAKDENTLRQSLAYILDNLETLNTICQLVHQNIYLCVSHLEKQEPTASPHSLPSSADTLSPQEDIGNPDILKEKLKANSELIDKLSDNLTKLPESFVQKLPDNPNMGLNAIDSLTLQNEDTAVPSRQTQQHTNNILQSVAKMMTFIDRFVCQAVFIPTDKPELKIVFLKNVKHSLEFYEEALYLQFNASFCRVNAQVLSQEFSRHLPELDTIFRGGYVWDTDSVTISRKYNDLMLEARSLEKEQIDLSKKLGPSLSELRNKTMQEMGVDCELGNLPKRL